MFWPGITKDVEENIRHCYACTKHQNSNQKEPLLPHDIPRLPWEKIGCDLFYKSGEYYLITVDYYSRFFEVDRVGSNAYAHQIVSCLKKQFAQYGIPSVLVSDNSPQFTSALFQKFIKDLEIAHKTSSPNFPQSNGLAERTVQTAKDILTKTDLAGDDFELAMLEYRNTPVDRLASPAQMLMSRNLRSIVPCTGELLSPKIVHHGEFVQNRKKQQSRQRKYHDRQSKELKPLQVGQPIQAQIQGKTWQSGTIVRADKLPRSYIIETNEGGTYRRNRRHIKVLCHSNRSPDAAEALETPHGESMGNPHAEALTSSPITAFAALTPPPKTPDLNSRPTSHDLRPAFHTPIPIPSTSRTTHADLQGDPYSTRSG